MAFTLLAATSLLAGCSGDDFNGNGNVNGNSNNITFNTNVNGFFSKASTYNSNDDLKTEGSFTCAAYNATTTTPYIDATTVVWNDTENDGANKWQFANGIKHGWPGASALDFFAYMPAEKPTYIGEISYAARSAQFVCTLPIDQSSTKEFICALAKDKTKANSPSGVSMTFQHVFAKLIFKLDNPDTDGITINSVKITQNDSEVGVYTSGTCTFNGTTPTWNDKGTSAAIIAKVDEPYLVIPHDYSATKMKITVDATWTKWNKVEHVIKTATIQNVSKGTGTDKLMKWEAGYSYLFTLTFTPDILVVNTEKWAEQM